MAWVDFEWTGERRCCPYGWSGQIDIVTGKLLCTIIQPMRIALNCVALAKVSFGLCRENVVIVEMGCGKEEVLHLQECNLLKMDAEPINQICCMVCWGWFCLVFLFLLSVNKFYHCAFVCSYTTVLHGSVLHNRIYWKLTLDTFWWWKMKSQLIFLMVISPALYIRCSFKFG